MSRIIRITLEFLKFFVFSVLGTLALFAFVIAMWLFPTSWFAKLVTFIVIAFAIFMLGGLLFCSIYDFYHKHIAGRKHP